MTTKAKTNECITLGTVSEAVADTTDIAGARERLKYLIGRKVILPGACVKRHEHLKLWLESGEASMKVFAEFTRAKDAERVVERKVRKRSKVSVIGELVSLGYQAVCLNNCRLVDGN